MNNPTAKDKMTKARAGLILDMRFFGALALKLQFKEDPTQPTGWVNGVHLGYNPEWIESLSLDEVKGFIAHEVMHCASNHHTRRCQRAPKRWNVAGDYVINPVLRDCGMALPAGGLLDQNFVGLSTEAVYGKLPEKHGDGPGGDGEGGWGEVRDYPGPGKDGDKDGKGQGKPSPSEMQEHEQDWKISTRQAAQAAKACGKLPGALEGFVDEILAPKVDWREMLRAYVERSAKNDYNWTRPNRRYLQGGIILPSLHSLELGEITLAIDTSGSVGSDELSQFAGELNSILEEYQACTVNLIWCDSRVQGTETYTQDELPIKLTAKGGGGTDFRPVFDHIDQSGDTPACLIYLTDMYGNFPGTAPAYPVLWIATTDRKAPFGETVRIEVGE